MQICLKVPVHTLHTTTTTTNVKECCLLRQANALLFGSSFTLQSHMGYMTVLTFLHVWLSLVIPLYIYIGVFNHKWFEALVRHSAFWHLCKPGVSWINCERPVPSIDSALSRLVFAESFVPRPRPLLVSAPDPFYTLTYAHAQGKGRGRKERVWGRGGRTCFRRYVILT